MKIFKLEPKDLNLHHWNASVYDGIVTVRAEDEEKARNKAALEFGTFVEVKSKVQPSPISPWLLNDYVDCKEENDSKYSIDGDEEILYPNPNNF